MFNFNNEKYQVLARFMELRDLVDVFVVGVTTQGVLDASARSWSPMDVLKEVAEQASVAQKLHIVNISFDEIQRPEFPHTLGVTDQEEIGQYKGRLKWFREAAMRNNMMQGFDDLSGRDSDLILLSDADEIPVPSALKHALATADLLRQQPGRVYVFDGSVDYTFSLRCQTGTRRHNWAVGKLMSGATARNVSLGSLRGPCKDVGTGKYANCSGLSDLSLAFCSDEGLEFCQWHMSWMGGFEAFQRKSATLAEGFGEVDPKFFADYIRKGCPRDLESLSLSALRYPRVPQSVEMSPSLFQPLLQTIDEMLGASAPNDLRNT